MRKIPQPAYIPCVEKLKMSTSVNIVESDNIKPILEIGNTVVWSDLAKTKFKSIADNNKHTIVDISMDLNAIKSVSLTKNITIDNDITADAKWFVKI